MSFNKTIHFPAQPSGFQVSFFGKPDIPAEELNSSTQDAYNRGKQEATSFYQGEVKKLREENRRMKIELTAIKNVIKRYMTNGKKFSQKTN